MTGRAATARRPAATPRRIDSCPSLRLVPHDRPLPRLDDEERIVLWLSRADPRSSLRRKRGLFALLFGARPCLMLANPRLEALRRYAILLRLDGRDLPDAEHRAMAAAGYDRDRRATIAAAVFAGSHA